MARRLEALGGTAVLVLAVLTVGVFAVGLHNFAGAVVVLVMLLGATGVFVAAHRQSDSASAWSALKWLVLLQVSTGLLLVETWVGMIGFGFVMLPLTSMALVTALLGTIVQTGRAIRTRRA